MRKRENPRNKAQQSKKATGDAKFPTCLMPSKLAALRKDS